MVETLLFVVAHADDLEIGAGGTCALLVEAGYNVHVVVVTDEDAPQVAQVRRREAVAGANALGVPSKNVHFLGLPDGAVDCNRSTVGALRALICEHKLQPVAAFTHTEADSHQDHIQTFRIVRAALRGCGIFKFAVRNSLMASAFSPCVFVAIDQVLDAKNRALVAHESQQRLDRIPLQKVRALEAHFAVGREGRFYEPFELDIQAETERTRLNALLSTLDGDPFNLMWAPLLSSGKVSILLGAVPGLLDVTVIELVARLQARLLGCAAGRLGAPAYGRVEVAQATDTSALAASGHVVLLGLPTDSPCLTAALEPNLSLCAVMLKSPEHGVVTVSRRNIVTPSSVQPLLLTVSNADALRQLLEGPSLEAVSQAVSDVFAGSQEAVVVGASAEIDGAEVLVRAA